MRKLRVLDLFSGIGGFSLGLERTGGFETVAFCEIDPFCRKVLAKHWPQVKQYEDVRELSGQQLAADGIVADVICGGFPCQDISVAGSGAGIEGERSSLWFEQWRLVCELRPVYVFVENVAALLGRGLGRVLSDLAAVGYDAEWHCIPASAVGAPHRRDRIWIVAYTHHPRLETPREEQQTTRAVECSEMAHAERQGLERYGVGGSIKGRRREPSNDTGTSGWWAIEPDVGRVAHGVPNRVDRLKALGNAVVPQIPELIGRAILASMQEAA